MDTQMKPNEQKAWAALIDAWNNFVVLPAEHNDDIHDYRQAIHTCQRIIATRIARRAAPELFGKNANILETPTGAAWDNKLGPQVIDPNNNDISRLLMPENKKQPPFAEGYNPWISVYYVSKGKPFECACWFFGTDSIVENCYFDGYLFHDKSKLDVINPLMFAIKKTVGIPHRHYDEVEGEEVEMPLPPGVIINEDILKAQGWNIVKDEMPPTEHRHEEITMEVKIMMNDGTIYEKAYYDFEEERWYKVTPGNIGDEEPLTEAPIFWKYLEDKKLKKKR